MTTYIIMQRHDTAAMWLIADPVLREGEVGWESDTNRSKHGNGATLWSDLPYDDDALIELVVGETEVLDARIDAIEGVDLTGVAYVDVANAFSKGGQSITAEAAGVVPLYVKGALGQTTDLFQARDSTGALLMAVANAGDVYLTAGHAFRSTYLTTPQNTDAYITFAGGSVQITNRTNVGAVALVAKGMAGQTGDLQQWQDSTGTMLSKVTANGSHVSGNLPVFARSFVIGDGSGADPGSRFAFQVGTGRVIQANATAGYGVQSAPTFQGAAPVALYGLWTRIVYDGPGTAAAARAILVPGPNLTNGAIVTDYAAVEIAAQGGLIGLLANSRVQINAESGATVPLTVKANATQTADLQEWQDSAGVSLARITAAGDLFAKTVALTDNYTWLGYMGSNYLRAASGGFNAIEGVTAVSAELASEVPLSVRGQLAQTGDLQQWQNSSGAALARVWSSGYISTVGGLYAASVEDVGTFSGPYISLGTTAITFVNRNNVGNIPLVSKGMAGQTGNLQQWQDSTGFSKLLVTNGGSIVGPYNFSLSGPGDVYLDAGPSATANLRVEGFGPTLSAGATALTIRESVDIAISTTTGTKIGTAANQKIGKWGVVPVVQPTGIVDADGTLADLTTKFNLLLSKLEATGELAVV